MYRLVLDCLIFSPHIPTVPARMTSTSIRLEMMLSARPNQGVSGLEDFRGRRQGGSIGRTWVKSGPRREALASSPDELQSADDQGRPLGAIPLGVAADFKG